MRIELNGQSREVDDGLTLADLLTELGHDVQRGGVAVALNLDVIPRRELPERPLAEGDRVDVVTAVGGG
jgi:sulfur carrier protein